MRIHPIIKPTILLGSLNSMLLQSYPNQIICIVH
uniref:Uncharacterized protein n=1 Tax=Arundo donax TaxID=35708 RepID=A0A0A9EPB5_ARUDO